MAGAAVVAGGSSGLAAPAALVMAEVGAFAIGAGIVNMVSAFADDSSAVPTSLAGCVVRPMGETASNIADAVTTGATGNYSNALGITATAVSVANSLIPDDGDSGGDDGDGGGDIGGDGSDGDSGGAGGDVGGAGGTRGGGGD